MLILTIVQSQFRLSLILLCQMSNEFSRTGVEELIPTVFGTGDAEPSAF
jgi:hypothetical protein